MKQIFQNLRNGNLETLEIPKPYPKKGEILIESLNSLISAGTEKMLMEFGKADYINKARQQPEKVKMVLDKIKSDGILTTIDSVFNKLNQPIPLGYCNVGIVREIGEGVNIF